MNAKATHALKAALDELRLRRAEIAALRSDRNEPIAVIGMACRFPGQSDTPSAFWQLREQPVIAILENADLYFLSPQSLAATAPTSPLREPATLQLDRGTAPTTRSSATGNLTGQ